MKMNPPFLEIPPDKPYANDLFDRKEFGDSLSSLFKSVEENIVLCVDAPWGQGKTTFAKMWAADLRLREIRTIYFDAYAHDYSDDPFVSFCAEIISLVETEFAEIPAIQDLKNDFKSKAIELGGKLLITGTRVGVKAITMGMVNDSDIDSVVSGKDSYAGITSSAASEIVGKAIEDYTFSKKGLAEFAKILSDLGTEVRKQQDYPLLIVVDELDRCRPDFALSLIERVKHLFTTDNVSFVLLTNTEQLHNYVKTVYGSDVDAKNYLHKFFTLSTELTIDRQDMHENDHSKYTTKLLSHYNINIQPSTYAALVRMFQYYEFTLREMERCLCVMSLYYAQLPSGRLTDESLISFLAVLRLRYPDSFAGLASGTMSYVSLLEETNIDKIENSDYPNFSCGRLFNLLQFLLCTDKENNEYIEDGDYIPFKQWLSSSPLNNQPFLKPSRIAAGVCDRVVSR